MAPPSYADLGKQARDLFSKNYRKDGLYVKIGSKTNRTTLLHVRSDFGLVKLDVKTKTPSGVEFNVNGTSNNDTGRVSSSLETKYLLKDHGITLKEKWNTDNILSSEVTIEDKVLQGLKLGASATFAPQSGKKTGTVKAGYKIDCLNVNSDVDLDYAGAILHGAAVLGYVYDGTTLAHLAFSFFVHFVLMRAAVRSLSTRERALISRDAALQPHNNELRVCVARNKRHARSFAARTGISSAAAGAADAIRFAFCSSSPLALHTSLFLYRLSRCRRNVTPCSNRLSSAFTFNVFIIACSYQGWLAGAQLSFDPSKSKLTKTNFAIGYSAPEFILHTNVYVPPTLVHGTRHDRCRARSKLM